MHRHRHIYVRSVRRPSPDLKKLSRAIIALAMAQAQTEASAARDHLDSQAAGSAKPEPSETGQAGV